MNLDVLDRWLRAPLPGGAIGLRDPGSRAALCIRSGPPPLRRFGEVVADLARSADLRDVERMGPPRRFVTEEGEHAVLQPLRARGAALLQPWVVAMVVADEAYAIIDGTSPHPDIEAAVELVARAMPMGRSARRARWPHYACPTGWLGLRRPLATCWLPPGAPRDPARLDVADAVPCGDPVERTQSLVWFGASPLAAASEPLSHPRWTGTLERARLRELHWVRATLSDGRFLYRVELCDGTEEHVAVLLELVASLEPEPDATGSVDPAGLEAFAWID